MLEVISYQSEVANTSHKLKKPDLTWRIGAGTKLYQVVCGMFLIDASIHFYISTVVYEIAWTLPVVGKSC